MRRVIHRLDGVLWPRGNARGTPDQPVVLLEVQMQAKAGFKHRLIAQTTRFAQLHPRVQHLEVVVVLPHRRLNLGPAELPRQQRAFLAEAHWLSLPVLPKKRIPNATEQILQPRPDLLEIVVSILGERFPLLTREEIMALINIPTDHLRHTRFAQDWMAEGEARGRTAVALRLLN